MTTFLKIFLPLYFALFFGLAVFWRSYLAWKRTGINPYKLGNSDNVHDFVGKLFRFTLAASAFIVLAFAFSHQLYSILIPIAWLTAPEVAIIGMIVLVLALIWVLVAQIQMGDSWRIGVDKQTASPLVQSGLFGISRNPIFLGMILMLIGLLLTLPTAVTLAVTALGVTLIHIQVRLEESFLLEKYGSDYLRYQSRVRRWI